jgi:hypothetical protein
MKSCASIITEGLDITGKSRQKIDRQIIVIDDLAERAKLSIIENGEPFLPWIHPGLHDL